MSNYSQVFTVKSNARRAARKQGVDPSTVTACSGGFHFPLGGVPAAKPKAAAPKAKAAKPKGQAKATKPKPAKAKAPKAKTGESLVDKVHKMIIRPEGATMKEIVQATGWLEHTARARISGIVKKHKLTIQRERLLGVTTYRAS